MLPTMSPNPSACGLGRERERLGEAPAFVKLDIEVTIAAEEPREAMRGRRRTHRREGQARYKPSSVAHLLGAARVAR